MCSSGTSPYLAEFDRQGMAHEDTDSERRWTLMDQMGSRRLTYKPLIEGA